MRKSRFFVKALKIAVFATLAVGALSFVVMSLWNALLPNIFAVRAISFWQAVGLLVLSKCLFGGFRPYGGGGRRWRGRMMERWEQMTPDQRERFKQGMRCGRNPKSDVEAPNREAAVQA